jgi:uncharacterized protein (TIGR03000 family)
VIVGSGAPVVGDAGYSAPVGGDLNYSAPIVGDEAVASAKQNRPATVVVRAPANVKILVNDQLTSRKSEEESFQTPNLKPGFVYSYTFKAETEIDGKPVTRTKRVTVRAGRRTEVDFSDLAETTRLTARVKIVLPRNATLFVDGVAFTSATTTSVYETPALAKGKVYYYNLEARFEGGRIDSLTQRVKIEAGKEVTVDFTELAAARASLR